MLSNRSGSASLIDDAEWLQQTEPIANEGLDFDSLFLKIYKPTDLSESRKEGAQSCSVRLNGTVVCRVNIRPSRPR